jgi:UDP-N-acetylglucosamine enolpyruvyl transferase
MFDMKRFVTISTYAKMCGINRTSVYDRIRAGTLIVSIYCEGSMIDIEQFPPCRYKVVKCTTLPPKIKKELPDWCYD